MWKQSRFVVNHTSSEETVIIDSFEACLVLTVLTLCPTQPPVRRLGLIVRLIHSRLWDGLSHQCLAFNSSFLSVDGITCHISF
jgi:hypothetical protein